MLTNRVVDALRPRTWSHLFFKAAPGLIFAFRRGKLTKNGSVTFDLTGRKFTFSGLLPFRAIVLTDLRS